MTGNKATANGELRLLVSLLSVWLSELIVSLSVVPAGIDVGSDVSTVGVNVGGNGVCVGARWVVACLGGSLSVRVE